MAKLVCKAPSNLIDDTENSGLIGRFVGLDDFCNTSMDDEKHGYVFERPRSTSFFENIQSIQTSISSRINTSLNSPLPKKDMKSVSDTTIPSSKFQGGNESTEEVFDDDGYDKYLDENDDDVNSIYSDHSLFVVSKDTPVAPQQDNTPAPIKKKENIFTPSLLLSLSYLSYTSSTKTSIASSSPENSIITTSKTADSICITESVTVSTSPVTSIMSPYSDDDLSVSKTTTDSIMSQDIINSITTTTNTTTTTTDCITEMNSSTVSDHNNSKSVTETTISYNKNPLSLSIDDINTNIHVSTESTTIVSSSSSSSSSTPVPPLQSQQLSPIHKYVLNKEDKNKTSLGKWLWTASSHFNVTLTRYPSTSYSLSNLWNSTSNPTYITVTEEDDSLLTTETTLDICEENELHV